MNSPVFLADSDHLAPAMNDVDINTVDGKGDGWERGRIYLLAAVRSWPVSACCDWRLSAHWQPAAGGAIEDSMAA